MRKCILVLSMVLCTLTCLFSGPFGLEMGQSYETLIKIGAQPTAFSSKKGYYLVEPPTPHYDFEEYLVRIDSEEGVFFIKAIGKDIEDSGFGFSTKSDFKEIRSMLDSAYGSSTLTDFLFPSSIWDDPDDWMMGLRKNERLYMANWKHSDGSAFTGDIGEIYLAARAASSSTGYLNLEYYGVKYDMLSEKAKREAAQVF